MSKIVNDAELRRAYGEIILGSSSFLLDKKPAFVKHLAPLEQGVLDKEYLRFYDNALRAGLLTEDGRREVLAQQGLWTETQETKLLHQESYVKGLRETKSSLALPSQVKEVNSQLETAQLDLYNQRAEKYTLVGMTAESFANKKLNELYIFNSLFADAALTRYFFAEDDYEELDEHEITSVISQYNEGIKHINETVLHRIAIASFFTKYFNLCDNNIYHFYGKPIATLTYFQSELANAAIYFKAVFASQHRPPDEIINDPAKIIDWHQTANNHDKIMKSAGANAKVGIMGMTADDIKEITGEKQVFSVFDYAENKGSVIAPGKKRLSMKELMAME